MTRLLTCALAVIGLGVVLTRPPARRALSAVAGSLRANPAELPGIAPPKELPGPVSEGDRNQPGGVPLSQPAETPSSAQEAAPGTEGHAASAAAPGDENSPADDVQDAPNAVSPLIKALEVYERAETAEKPVSKVP